MPWPMFTLPSAFNGAALACFVAMELQRASDAVALFGQFALGAVAVRSPQLPLLRPVRFGFDLRPIAKSGVPSAS